MSAKQQRVTRLIIGGILILLALCITLTIELPSKALQYVLAIILALGAGMIAALIAGEIHVSYARPRGLISTETKTLPSALRAGGGMAVFVVVLGAWIYVYSLQAPAVTVPRKDESRDPGRVDPWTSDGSSPAPSGGVTGFRLRLRNFTLLSPGCVWCGPQGQPGGRLSYQVTQATQGGEEREVCGETQVGAPHYAPIFAESIGAEIPISVSEDQDVLRLRIRIRIQHDEHPSVADVMVDARRVESAYKSSQWSVPGRRVRLLEGREASRADAVAWHGVIEIELSTEPDSEYRPALAVYELEVQTLICDTCVRVEEPSKFRITGLTKFQFEDVANGIPADAQGRTQLQAEQRAQNRTVRAYNFRLRTLGFSEDHHGYMVGVADHDEVRFVVRIEQLDASAKILRLSVNRFDNSGLPSAGEQVWDVRLRRSGSKAVLPSVFTLQSTTQDLRLPSAD